MSKYRDAILEKPVVETIKSACPLCLSDVKGDDIYLFYCQKCNILFRREELALEHAAHINAVVKERIVQKYDADKDKLRIDTSEPHIPLKNIKVKIPRETVYVASLTSNVLHTSNCPFAKNIKKSNRKIFKSQEEAKGYKHCKCI